MPAELRPRQAEVLEPLRSRYIHADPPGAGKTPVGLSWLKAHGADRTIVVAPKIVLEQWADQAATWLPNVEPIIGAGSPKQRDAALDAYRSTPRAMLIVNPEVLVRDKAAMLLAAGRTDALLVDEAHMAAGRSTLRHKALTQLARRIELCELATASPILNSAEEAWSLLNLIDPRHWSSFWRWAHEHFWTEQRYYQGRTQRPIVEIGDPKPGALERMAADVADVLVARDEDYVLPDLAKLVTHPVNVKLSDAEREVYDSMVRYSWLSDFGSTVFASNEVSKMTRLRQLASDWCALIPDADVYGTKVIRATDLVAELDRPALMLAGYTTTVDSAVERLERIGVRAVRYTGADNEKARKQAKARFIDGSAQVMVGTLGALRVGLDGLQHRAADVVLIDREWTPELNRQAVGRVRRYGQPSKQVHVWNVVAEDTIDATIAEALERKQSVVNTIIGRSAADVLHAA